MTPNAAQGGAVSNDNRHPPIPVPPGGFRTNEEEADWLTATIAMRLREALSVVGVKAIPSPAGLRDLLLLSLDAASKRGRSRP